MKKLSAIAVVLATVLCCVPCNAQASESATIIIPKERVAAELQQQIDNEVAKVEAMLAMRGGDDQVVETEVVRTEICPVTGEVGGQPAGGAICSGFYWNPNGGTNVSVYVGFGGGTVPISVSFGVISQSSVAYFQKTPDSVNYYKLWVTRNVQVTEMRLYLVDTVTGERTYYGTSYPTSYYSYVLFCKRA